MDATVRETPLPGPAPKLRPLPLVIFSSRWLQLPLYLGLIVAQMVYVVQFLRELYHLVGHLMSFSRADTGNGISNLPKTSGWMTPNFPIRTSAG